MTKSAKDKIQYGTAAATLFLGWVLVFIAYFQAPNGGIHDSILWIFAQSLLYAASIFGVAAYISDRFSRIESKINSKLKDNDTTNEEL